MGNKEIKINKSSMRFMREKNKSNVRNNQDEEEEEIIKLDIFSK